MQPQMRVTLLSRTPLLVCSTAIRTCWQSFERSDNGGIRDCELITRIGNELRHSSTLEHLHYNFYIKNISRAVLQELSRHRLASLSVKSTRYTLKELKNEQNPFKFNDFAAAARYIVLTGDIEVDNASICALENLRKIVANGAKLDIAKYCLPEAYKTELTYSINARSLQNFISLRTSKRALEEIRLLAMAIYEAIPQDHKFIFKEFIARDE